MPEVVQERLGQLSEERRKTAITVFIRQYLTGNLEPWRGAEIWPPMRSEHKAIPEEGTTFDEVTWQSLKE